jgi:superfamily I DNA/RNA helicase
MEGGWIRFLIKKGPERLIPIVGRYGLATPSRSGLSARTIHSVKGMEFPAVCLVLSTQIAKGVIDHLVDRGGSGGAQENMRKIYAAACTRNAC